VQSPGLGGGVPAPLGSIRIWQRSALACTGTPELSVMVSANDSAGVAE